MSALTTTVRIGRRPVHDRELRVVAYELRAAGVGTNTAADLFLAGMVDVGLDRLGSGHDVVVALPDGVIRSGGLAHLPMDRLVLDIGPDHVIDDELESLLRSARAGGLRIRVADPIEHPALAQIAEVADLVSVAVATLTPEERRRRRGALGRLGRHVIATGVDDHDVHEDARSAGYDLFTGTVLSNPNVVSGRRLAADRMALLHLVAVLDDPSASVDALEAAVASSPSLSYQVLRYVNSAFVGLRTEVDSIRRAVVLVGPPVLRQLTGLLLLQQSGDKPVEASRVALARARMCERIGVELGDPRPAYHTVGLLSAVDLLTDVPLEEAIADLPLTTEVVDALLHHEGRLGRVLQAARLYERCDWDDPVLSSFDPHVLSEAYFSGLRWADEALAVDASVA